MDEYRGNYTWKSACRKVIEHSEKAVNSMKIKRIFTETRSESICVCVKYSSKQFGYWCPLHCSSGGSKWFSATVGDQYHGRPNGKQPLMDRSLTDNRDQEVIHQEVATRVPISPYYTHVTCNANLCTKEASIPTPFWGCDCDQLTMSFKSEEGGFTDVQQ